MASQKHREIKKSGGPYLAAAVFCDSIVEGSDRTMTIVRMVDRLTLMVPADAPPDFPSEEKRFPVTMNALLSFRTGYAKGKHHISLVMHSPGGKKQSASSQVLELGKEPNSGINLKIGLHIAIKSGGLFWFDVVLNGKVVTRMPLDVVVARAPKEDAKTTALTKKKKK